MINWRELFHSQIYRFSKFLVYAELLTAALLLFSSLSPIPVSHLLQQTLLSSASPKETVSESGQPAEDNAAPKKDYIHWVDFTVTNEALRQALRLDVDSYLTDCHFNWIELLAYLAARYGGDFSRYRAADMDALAEKIRGGASMDTLTDGMKYYPYYLEAYTAVLGGMVGTYEIEEADPKAANEDSKTETGKTTNSGGSASNGTGATSAPRHWVHKYGLKAFSPIAKYFPYQDYDDFGAARSYGFKRQHLGHDMMGQVGTPVIAVESGYVEAIGWNQYGGWRLGIRSFDKKRYYYYAHLRKNYPYHKSLKKGSIVQAGDVIGYLGRTGYSRTENTNNIDEPHLHFGIQLIFDESQKEGNNEIWINCYELVKFLQLNRSETVKNQETKEYSRVWNMKDPAVSSGA